MGLGLVLGLGLGLGLVLGLGLGLGLGFGLVLGLGLGFGQGLGLGLVNRWGPPRSSTFLGENRRRRTTKSGCLQMSLLGSTAISGLSSVDACKLWQRARTHCFDELLQWLLRWRY